MSSRTDRVDELFLAASRIPPAERAAWLERACGGDEGLRAEVASLLEHDSAGGALDAAGRAVESEAREALAASGSRVMEGVPDGAPDGVPETIGSYRIVRVLGSGGQGTVYEAEQERPRRTVALKVLRAGLATPATLRRFEWEAEVLGRLEHPGIARVFEAGTADTGDGPRPFFAMELVRGQSITRYAEAAGLGTRARLALLTEVCEAVHHAHQKGVVHRDLKPANVLVDEAGRPKVLDFGVARATDADLRATTLRTRAGEIVGTLPYMSPEQVGGDPAAVDTRSDVYALGVLLHELLTGRLPVEVRDLPLPQAVHAIAHEEPARLGTVDRSLRGDVETIVAKAIEKDPERRYASALELADDLRRHLADEPIVARPPSTFYQLKKFARRNRAVAAGLAIAFVALAAATAVSTRLYLDTDAAREAAELAGQAEREAKEAAEEALAVARDETLASNQVRRFLTDLFLEARVVAGQRSDVTLRDLVDRGAPRVWEEFEHNPSVQADLMGVIGLVYDSLGAYEAAEPLLAESVRITRELGESDAHFLVVALIRLAETRRELGDYVGALELFSEAAALARETPGSTPAEYHKALKEQGLTLARLGRHEEAREVLAELLEHAEEEHVDERQLLVVRQTLAMILRFGGDTAGAVRELRAIEDVLVARGEGESDSMIRLLVSQADCLLTLGDVDAMEEVLLRAQAIRTSGAVEDHPDYYLIDGQLARVALQRGDLEEAEEGLSKVLAFQESQGMVVHAERSVTLFELGRVRFLQGRFEEAARLFVETLDVVQRTLGSDHPNRLPPARELERALVRLAAEPWEGEGEPAWGEVLDEATAVLEAGGHADEARSLVDAVLAAGE